MQLQVGQPRLGCRLSNGSTPPVVLAPAVPRRVSCRQQLRDVTVNTTKATTLSYDDLADAVSRADPERRVLQEMNFFKMIEACPDWPSLQRLEEGIRERYERQPALVVTVLIRASEVVDMETADEGTRRAVNRLLNTVIAPFMIKNVLSIRATTLHVVLPALAALGYGGNAQLNAVLVKMYESAVPSLKSGAVCSCAAAFAQLGVRLPAALLGTAVDRVSALIFFMTPADYGNLAAALAPYRTLPPLCREHRWLLRLSSNALPHLEEIPGEQLVDLLGLFVKMEYTLSSSWVAAFQRALLAALPGLEAPGAYASLLFSLAKGSLAITEDFLSALLTRLAAPGPRTPAAAGRPAGRSPSLLSRMRPTELAVVAAVLSIYGYTPGEGVVAEYVAALEARAGEFEAKQVVTVVDTCVELGIPLGPDLLDELLAVSEPGLGGLAAGRLLALAAALVEAGHTPDGPWQRQMQGALAAAAGRASAPELAEVAAVLMHMPYAYPADGDSTAAVMESIKARAVALGGVDPQTRGSILAALQHLRHPGAAAFADSLQPPPPPSPPPPPPAVAPPPAAPMNAPAAAKASGSSRTAATETTAAAAAVPAAKGRTRAAAAAAAAAPPPSPPAASVAAKGRGRSAAGGSMDGGLGAEERAIDGSEEEAAPPRPSAAKRAAAAAPPPPAPAAFTRAAAPPPTVAAAPSAAPPPSPPAAAGGDDGFVASTRTSRRRR